jgi:hypothetical protein
MTVCKFYFDEHVPRAAAKALTAKGADVLMAVDAGYDSFPDDTQLRLAKSESRIVVTHDADFPFWADDFIARGESFSGIAYCYPDKYKGDVGGLIYALECIFVAMPRRGDA